VTYGDGVGDVDVRATIALHRKEKRLATVTATQPPGRFGAIRHEGTRVTGFQEKPVGDGGWINGGFFVLSPQVGRYIDGDSTVWEREPMERLAAEGQLSVYFHGGFWHPMDTLRDRRYLEDLWASGKAPWKIW
jgi:glucose-1-phosphate cytidylyltransferase